MAFRLSFRIGQCMEMKDTMKSPIQRQLEIFSAALERPAGPERDAFLAQACAGDAGLRQQVGALLAGHEEAATFLDKAAGPVGTSGNSHRSDHGEGRRQNRTL